MRGAAPGRCTARPYSSRWRAVFQQNVPTRPSALMPERVERRREAAHALRPLGERGLDLAVRRGGDERLVPEQLLRAVEDVGQRQRAVLHESEHGHSRKLARPRQPTFGGRPRATIAVRLGAHAHRSGRRVPRRGFHVDEGRAGAPRRRARRVRRAPDHRHRRPHRDGRRRPGGLRRRVRGRAGAVRVLVGGWRDAAGGRRRGDAHPRRRATGSPVRRARTSCTCTRARSNRPTCGRCAPPGPRCYSCSAGTTATTPRPCCTTPGASPAPACGSRSCSRQPEARDDALALLRATGRTVVTCDERAAPAGADRAGARPGRARRSCTGGTSVGGRGPAVGPRFRRLVRVATPDAVGARRGRAGADPRGAGARRRRRLRHHRRPLRGRRRGRAHRRGRPRRAGGGGGRAGRGPGRGRRRPGRGRPARADRGAG